MRRVLVIAFYFPPMGGAGVQRTLKFIKYLPTCGWEPVVLTVHPGGSHLYDASLNEEIPAKLTVKRSRALLPPAWLPWRVRSWLSRWLLAVDEQLGWLPFAVPAGLKLIRSQQIQAIYTTSAPYTAHLIGATLKQRTRLPWIADFRDPWIDNFAAPFPSQLHAALATRLERQVAMNADRLVVVSEPMRQAFLTRYPQLTPGHVATIPNGYDPDDFTGLEPVPENSQHMVIVYSGSFYGGRSARTFLDGLALAIQQGGLPRHQVQVHLIGNTGKATAQMVREKHLQDIVQIYGYLAHRHTLSYLLAADILLLVVGSGQGSQAVLTGKLFEYLAAEKHVLCLSPAGAAADLVRTAQAGSVVDADDVPAIAHQLQELFQRWQSGNLTPEFDRKVIEQFDRRKLTARLAGYLDELAGTTLESEHSRQEIERIRETYNTRYHPEPQNRRYTWHPRNPVSIYFRQVQERQLVQSLNRANLELERLTVLDIGCGQGGLLRFLLSLGAEPENLYGVDLMAYRLAQARQLSPNSLHWQVSDAQALPFVSASFDMVCQFTMFSALFDPQMRKQVAGEIQRVLRPGGSLLWYDMRLAHSSTTRGIDLPELKALFPGWRLHVQHLHSPWAGRLARRSIPLAEIFDLPPWSNRSHLLARLEKPLI